MDWTSLQRQQLRNLLQSLLLLASMALLCGYLAWIIGGTPLALLASALVVTGFLFNQRLSSRLILRLYRGEAIPPGAVPRLYQILQLLRHRAGLTNLPQLYYIPSSVMNAFATGTVDNAVIAISDGLLRRLTLREVAAVLAHELSHIRHNDLQVMGFADLISRLTHLLSMAGQLLLLINLPLLLFSDYHIAWTPILLLLVAPGISTLGQLALSRNREYHADLGAAELTGDPQGLASALQKMEWYQGRVLEQLLMPGKGLPDPSLLRGHPPTTERIRRLQELEAGISRQQGDALAQLLYQDADPVQQPPLMHRPRWRRSGLWY